MANVVGSLLIEISASLAKFQADLGKANKLAEQSAKQMSRAFGTVKTALEAIGVAVSVRAFVGLIKGSIDAADRLQDLSQKTGIAVETLGGIGFAAKQAGTDIDAVTRELSRFNLTIAKAIGGDQQAGKVFSQIGISLEDLKNLKPDEIFTKTADAFNKFADGPNKAAIASELFGKSYREIIPLLNEGGDALRENISYFQKYSGVTTDLAQKSDKFNDEVEKAKLLTGAFANTLAAKLLPSLQGLVELFVESKEKGDGFNETTDTIVDGMKNIAKGAVIAGREIIGVADTLGGMAAMGAALFRLDFAAIKAIDAAIVDRQKSLSADRDKILAAIDGKTGAGTGPRRPPRPNAPSLGSKDSDAAAKALFDQQIKVFEQQIKDEEELLKDREHFLDQYYKDDQLGLADYFDRRKSIISDAISKELKSYDDEIAALKEFAAKAAPKDRIEAETKVSDAVAKRAKAEQDAAIKSIDLWFEQKRAAKEFQNQVEEIGIQLAALSGDTISAGLQQFDKANEKFRQQAAARASSPSGEDQAAGKAALDQLATLRERVAQQLQLTKAQKDYGDTLDDISTLQGRINLEQQTGAITEIDAINKRAALVKNYIGVLQNELRVYAELAASLPAGDARNDALRNIQRIQLEIDKLAASADELADKFRGIFTDAISSGLADIVTGTKSVKDAFRDMERQIVSSISHIASQNIAEAIFGKSGPASGAGGLLASLFGGGGGSSGGIAGIFASLFGGGGSGYGMNVRASGGPVAANQPYLVGESGRELFVPKQSGTIIPNNVLESKRAQSGNSISINVNVLPGASRTTADQAALQTGAAVQRALARNG